MYAPETKILVIDDMKTMRMVMKKCLKELGFTNLAEADDGETAWPLIDQEASAGTPFQLILSDWNMPKLSGLDLLKKIRRCRMGFSSIVFVVYLKTVQRAPELSQVVKIQLIFRWLHQCVLGFHRESELYLQCLQLLH